MESQCGEYDITLYDLVISLFPYLQSISRKTQIHMICKPLNPAPPDSVPLCNIQSLSLAPLMTRLLRQPSILLFAQQVFV